MSSEIPAILIVAHRRPEYLSLVIESVLESKPRALYVSIDGPREYVLNELLQVAECQKLAYEISNKTSIPVHFKFHNINIGCALNIISSIDWAFKNEECLVVLEEDCLPHKTFLSYFTFQLSRIKNINRIWVVSGYRPEIENIDLHENSFTHIPLAWGWATWKHKWHEMRLNILNSAFEPNLLELCKLSAMEVFWNIGARRATLGWIDTWDLQLADAMHRNDKLTLMPEKNQISNIGTDDLSLHTFGTSKFFETESYDFELPTTSSPIEEFIESIITKNDKYISREMNNVFWYHKYTPIIKYFSQKIFNYSKGRGNLVHRIENFKL